MSVERTLKRFKEHEPFERTSWSMVDDRNLFLRAYSILDVEFVPTLFIRQYHFFAQTARQHSS